MRAPHSGHEWGCKCNVQWCNIAPGAHVCNMYAPTPFGPTGDVMLFMYVMHAMVSLPLWESPSCGGEPWTFFCTCSRCPSLKSIQTRGANVVLDSRTVALDLRSVALASWVSVSLFCIRVLWLWIRGMGLLDSWIRALCLWVHVM